MNCNCNRTINRMEDITVDSEPRTQLEISARLAGQLDDLVERLKELYPEDTVSLHYALGYAVKSGHIAVRDELKLERGRPDEIAVRPSHRPPLGAYRTLAEPRARLEGEAA